MSGAVELVLKGAIPEEEDTHTPDHVDWTEYQPAWCFDQVGNPIGTAKDWKKLDEGKKLRDAKLYWANFQGNQQVVRE